MKPRLQMRILPEGIVSSFFLLFQLQYTFLEIAKSWICLHIHGQSGLVSVRFAWFSLKDGESEKELICFCAFF